MPNITAPAISTRFRLRLTVGERVAIGPGKVALLEAIREHHSINAAAKALGMSYKRAWDLINELNASLAEPAVASVKGGSTGGGTELTATGMTLVALYRSVEERAELACKPELDRLKALLTEQPR